MNRLLILAFALCGGSLVAAGQNISCQRSGNMTYCSDGTTANTSGETTYFSDGTIMNRSGNFLYFTPPNPPTVPTVVQQPRPNWKVALSKELERENSERLLSDVRVCISFPEDFKKQAAKSTAFHREQIHDRMASLDSWEVPEETKKPWREKLQAELKELDDSAVPASWRIDSAADFQECLDAQEQDWQNMLILARRHNDFLSLGASAQGAMQMAKYLQDHFGEPRFSVFTLEQREEAYYAVKNAQQSTANR
jgi:hypothetical protein